VHRFTAGDGIMICGIRIPHEFGLEGHSDADVGLHALTDALLGTIGNGLALAVKDERSREAALITFLVTASGLGLWGVGSAFWGVVAGAVSLAVQHWRPLR